ncbi:hypothetical protein RvY_18012 [Ramazzottius varieornatus]|uniref:TM2 domain-containing protein n=1 Tax=Ramazzottius varieornatus TaxID=947166 RepID=A0A1D1W484_RAMVA|nr:hypothetical protein RvY_18012 [Ramazzottius varieornatus]
MVATDALRRAVLSFSLFLSSTCASSNSARALDNPMVEKLKPCSSLLTGQFRCLDRNIDLGAQQLEGCQPSKLQPNLAFAKVKCEAAPGVVCDGLGANSTFWKDVPCKYSSGHRYDVSLILSVVLGMFGVDRFYLGYPGVGLLKSCTLGGFFLLQLLDIILIASGTLRPADGSHYVIPFYGPGIEMASIFAPGSDQF